MTALASLVRPGITVAVGDGLGGPRSAYAELSDAAESAGGVRLLLGWNPVADPVLRLEAFDDVRALMSGWGLRAAIDAGRVHAPPIRLSTIPALLHGPLRPDLLLATVVPHPDGGFAFGTEVTWLRAAIDAGAQIAAVVAAASPRADACPPLPVDQVVVVGETSEPPITLASTPPGDVHRALAERIATLLPEDARIQVGPGPLGAAVLDAIDRPVHLDSGLLPEGVVDLDRRGLVLGTPVATYLAGGPDLLAWADGRPLLHRLEHTHDITRLSSGSPLVAVNMALEIDEQGQVNVEGLGGSAIGGIGGHPDYAVAAARSLGGLSIIALPSSHRGRSTLVETLSMPVSTVGHDVDVVVTERGAADVRGLDRAERAIAIRAIFA